MKRGLFAAILGALCFTPFVSLSAHHPDRASHPVTPVIDLIGPLGNRLPPGYRRKYNRPTFVGGYLAYKIAPSSQEAMAWHRAVHADAYKHPKKHQRLEQHYFYPKPWQQMRVGPRRSASAESVGSASMEPTQMLEQGALDIKNTEELMPPFNAEAAADFPDVNVQPLENESLTEPTEQIDESDLRSMLKSVE